MAREYKYDPANFLSLLEDYGSREAHRLRRNVSIVSFTIVVIHLLEVPPSEIQIGNVSIPDDKEWMAILLAFSLLVYWSVLFGLRYLADFRAHEERVRVAQAETIYVRSRLEKKRKQRDRGDTPSGTTLEIKRLESYLAAFDRQESRSKSGRRLLSIARLTEWVPTLIIALIASIIIVPEVFSMMMRALR